MRRKKYIVISRRASARIGRKPRMSSPVSAPPQATQSCVIAPHLKDEITTASGKYGRMFNGLPINDCAPDALLALGRSGALLDAQRDMQDGAATQAIPTAAGWPIFGQFIAHN